MKKVIILLLLTTTITATAQNKIEKLSYGKNTIAVPENCVAESEYKISECNGFSAMWLYLESAESSTRKKMLKQIEEQIKYIEKRQIKFNSQDQPFEGALYKMEDSTYRYVGFGKVDEMPTLLIIGVKNEIKSNADLNQFEKYFITLP